LPIFQIPRRNILEAYVRADDSLTRYWRDGSDDRRHYLDRSAAILCSALRELLDDQEFWRQLQAFGRNLSADSLYENDVLPLVRDLNALMVLELNVLRGAGVSKRKTEKLMAELLAATSMKQPTPEILLGLKKRLAKAAKVICKVPPRSWDNVFRQAYVLSNGVLVVGGVGTIIANGAASIALAPAAASILSGAELAINRLEAIDAFLEKTKKR
jgi:hypothetical protein